MNKISKNIECNFNLNFLLLNKIPLQSLKSSVFSFISCFIFIFRVTPFSWVRFGHINLGSICLSKSIFPEATSHNIESCNSIDSYLFHWISSYDWLTNCVFFLCLTKKAHVLFFPLKMFSWKSKHFTGEKKNLNQTRWIGDFLPIQWSFWSLFFWFN